MNQMENRNSKVVILMFLSTLISSSFTESARGFEMVEPIELDIKPITPIKVDPVDNLIDAMIMVESRGNDSAIGDRHLGEPSVGVLQIRPIMVREVNRILKKTGSENQFKLKDRFSREKSIEMFKVWFDYYHSDSEFETIARSWNGGPKGPQNSRTLRYWEKVQNQLN